MKYSLCLDFECLDELLSFNTKLYLLESPKDEETGMILKGLDELPLPNEVIKKSIQKNKKEEEKDESLKKLLKKEKKPKKEDDKRGRSTASFHNSVKEYIKLHSNIPYREAMKIVGQNQKQIKE
jgi:hypothetical protein